MKQMSTPTLKQPAFSRRKVKFISGLKKKSIFKESWEETEVVFVKPPEGLTFLSLESVKEITEENIGSFVSVTFPRC